MVGVLTHVSHPLLQRSWGNSKAHETHRQFSSTHFRSREPVANINTCIVKIHMIVYVHACIFIYDFRFVSHRWSRMRRLIMTMAAMKTTRTPVSLLMAMMTRQLLDLLSNQQKNPHAWGSTSKDESLKTKKINCWRKQRNA